MFINCKGTLIDFETPRVMGILNLTPDSFYDGGKYRSEKEILSQTEKMLKEGATFIDIGGYSSRPGAEEISEKEELQRILPVIDLLLKKFPEILISVDTFRSKVAEESIRSGAALINDISGGQLDEKMLKTAAELQVPYIMMHMRGNPKNMKDLNQYDDVVNDIMFYFSEKIAAARELGINDIIIDPGFGFSKNIEQNFQLLSHLKFFKELELPVLSGVSRKSMIYKTLGTDPENALNGTTVLNTISIMNGANILRVHDVKEAMEVVKLCGKIKN